MKLTALRRDSQSQACPWSATVQVPRRGRRCRAFTLLEVLIAMGLFFMAIFAILDATSQGLRAAKSLERNVPAIGMMIGEMLLTNRLDADVGEWAFPEPYEGFRLAWERHEIATNGLYDISCTVSGDLDGRPYRSTSIVRLWKPDWARPLPGVRR